MIFIFCYRIGCDGLNEVLVINYIFVGEVWRIGK